MKITNITGIPLPLAVWALHDNYDYVNEPNYISVTSLMKPLRHIIIPPRLPVEDQQQDVGDYVSRALGNSLHTAIEAAWLLNHEKALELLGYPASVIKRVLINPTDEQLDQVKDPIPVYLEQRAFRKIVVDGQTFTIGGKFDMVTEGIVNDTKSTSAYSWVFGGRDDEHQLQGSQYRWLDAGRVLEGHKPRITEDFLRINYIFTDWQKMQARSNPNYPQKRTESKDIPLLPLDEIETWIRNKIRLIVKYRNTPEADLPECTDEELWRSAPKYKYFNDAAKANLPGARSTKNFDDLNEARTFQAEKGGNGVIVTVPSEPKRCGFCPAFEGCSQKNRYFS